MVVMVEWGLNLWFNWSTELQSKGNILSVCLGSLITWCNYCDEITLIEIPSALQEGAFILVSIKVNSKLPSNAPKLTRGWLDYL